jgi:hypothetical protein
MAVTINADNGVSSGSAGLKSSADSTGVLALQTNGTTAVTVNASQQVGIGNTSPAVPLQIGSGAADATIRFGATSNGYDIGRNNSSGDFIQNATQTSPYNQFVWQQAGTESVRFNTYGIGLGATNPNSGMGIQFPGTQSASSNANTLDDYEEGSWTPTVTSGTGSITTVVVGGQYRKVGGLVSLQFTYQITNNGTGASSITIAGLPFTNTIGANTSAGVMREIAVNGQTGSIYFNSTTTLLAVNYVSGYPGGASNYWVGSICYYAA